VAVGKKVGEMMSNLAFFQRISPSATKGCGSFQWSGCVSGCRRVRSESDSVGREALDKSIRRTIRDWIILN
jgi:hypothetical protein